MLVLRGVQRRHFCFVTLPVFWLALSCLTSATVYRSELSPAAKCTLVVHKFDYPIHDNCTVQQVCRAECRESVVAQNVSSTCNSEDEEPMLCEIVKEQNCIINKDFDPQCSNHVCTLHFTKVCKEGLTDCTEEDCDDEETSDCREEAIEGCNADDQGELGHEQCQIVNQIDSVKCNCSHIKEACSTVDQEFCLVNEQPGPHFRRQVLSDDWENIFLQDVMDILAQEQRWVRLADVNEDARVSKDEELRPDLSARIPNMRSNDENRSQLPERVDEEAGALLDDDELDLPSSSMDQDCLGECQKIDEIRCDEVEPSNFTCHSHNKTVLENTTRMRCDKVQMMDCTLNTTESTACTRPQLVCHFINEKLCRTERRQQVDYQCRTVEMTRCRPVTEKMCSGFVPLQLLSVSSQHLIPPQVPDRQLCHEVIREACIKQPRQACSNFTTVIPTDVCTVRKKKICYHTRPTGNDCKTEKKAQECPLVVKETCRDSPTQVERPAIITICSATPSRQCQKARARKLCRNTCNHHPAKAVPKKAECFTMRVPQQDCKLIPDMSPPCSIENCQPEEVKVCRVRLPGCLRRECRHRIKNSCRMHLNGTTSTADNRAKNTATRNNCNCEDVPVRRCVPCPPKMNCRPVTVKTCFRSADPACQPTLSCNHICEKKFLCPICNKTWHQIFQFNPSPLSPITHKTETDASAPLLKPIPLQTSTASSGPGSGPNKVFQGASTRSFPKSRGQSIKPPT